MTEQRHRGYGHPSPEEIADLFFALCLKSEDLKKCVRRICDLTLMAGREAADAEQRRIYVLVHGEFGDIRQGL